MQQAKDEALDERLYLGAAVLGLTNALVELTGGLTGLVSSITDTQLIGFAGPRHRCRRDSVDGPSNFLSSRMSAGQQELNIRRAAYTGIAYMVVALVAPFFAIGNRVTALVVTWTIAVLVTCAFAYYSAFSTTRRSFEESGGCWPLGWALR